VTDERDRYEDWCREHDLDPDVSWGEWLESGDDPYTSRGLRRWDFL
jgi:hypothetical protein